jgi:putative membrane protein
MEYVPRERVGLLTGVLSVVSLAVVFAAAGGRIPASSVPAAPEWVLETIPHVNAALSAAAIGTIAVGWRAIRRGAIERHRVAMLVSFGLFATFLALYLYRLTVTGGPQPFPGPEAVYRFVYLPLLAVHILLAIVCIPLLYYVLLLAFSRPIAELPGTGHARVGRVAAALWLISFSLGIVVYGLLHVVY